MLLLVPPRGNFACHKRIKLQGFWNEPYSAFFFGGGGVLSRVYDFKYLDLVPVVTLEFLGSLFTGFE